MSSIFWFAFHAVTPMLLLMLLGWGLMFGGDNPILGTENLFILGNADLSYYDGTIRIPNKTGCVNNQHINKIPAI
mgnify:CR=1 FL=1